MEFIRFEGGEKKTTVIESKEKKGKYFMVSTVRLPFSACTVPFETMVFTCTKNGRITNWSEKDGTRYYTWEQALAGHEEMIKKWGTPIEEGEN